MTTAEDYEKNKAYNAKYHALHREQRNADRMRLYYKTKNAKKHKEKKPLPERHYKADWNCYE